MFRPIEPGGIGTESQQLRRPSKKGDWRLDIPTRHCGRRNSAESCQTGPANSSERTDSMLSRPHQGVRRSIGQNDPLSPVGRTRDFTPRVDEGVVCQGANQGSWRAHWPSAAWSLSESPGVARRRPQFTTDSYPAGQEVGSSRRSPPTRQNGRGQAWGLGLPNGPAAASCRAPARRSWGSGGSISASHRGSATCPREGGSRVRGAPQRPFGASAEARLGRFGRLERFLGPTRI